MRIDRKQHSFLVTTLLLSGVGVGLYVAACRASAGPPGGTAPGLILGAAAAILVVFSILLGMQRRLQRWSLGRASFWLRSHLWMGMLAGIFALLHGGFHRGGGLTSALTIVLGLCVCSGLLGAAVQHIIPRALNLGGDYKSVNDPALAIALARRQAQQLFEELQLQNNREGRAELSQFYKSLLLPFLRGLYDVRSPLATAAEAGLTFDGLLSCVAPELHPTVHKLHELCESVRHARRQLVVRDVLHGWLLVHIPMAMALLILLALHAVTALRY